MDKRKLTLGERSYLLNLLAEQLPSWSSEVLWEFTEDLSRRQRGWIIRLNREQKYDQLKSIVKKLIGEHYRRKHHAKQIPNQEG